jgi:hypothetical protein
VFQDWRRPRGFIQHHASFRLGERSLRTEGRRAKEKQCFILENRLYHFLSARYFEPSDTFYVLERINLRSTDAERQQYDIKQQQQQQQQQWDIDNACEMQRIR